MTDELDDPLRLPQAPPAAARPALPLATAVMPVIGAVVLWRLTGSIHALWFAALGPVMVVASYADGLRGARRSRRKAVREATRELAALGDMVETRHAAERTRAWRRTPDVAGYATDPEEIWRVVPGRAETVVVGRGRGASALVLQGDPHDEAGRAVRRRARAIADMPVTVPLTAGIAVSGPPRLAGAVVRALVLQVCLAQAPGRVRLVGDPRLGALPHADATRGAVLYAGTADRPVPPDVDIPIVEVQEGAPPPPRCAAVLTLDGAGGARLDHDGSSRIVDVEGISADQAEALARLLGERAATLGQRLDGMVALADLPETPGAGALAAVVGVSAGEPVCLDLVADGPHAVVIGVTGSGKSELLTTWIVGLCRGRSPQEVALLLVDFKGGRTFDAVAGWPHVTGVLTDLDDRAAVRAVESLRAEVRHRERTLAELGARDVAEAAGALGRLVIVVDEYAALVAAHLELHELFADIAARGRALGMHLILASQRAAGAFRDGVLANAPLRIAFRVTDAADSRAVLGHNDAALLSGEVGARGTALVRRAADTAPRTVRIARTVAADLDAVAAASVEAPPARAPWLPPLPARVGLADARAVADAADVRPGLLLGVADEPDRQRRSLVRLADDAGGLAVIGGAGSGRSTLLRSLAAQAAHAVWIDADPERAWDGVAALDELPPGAVVLVDDADAIAARLPGEYGAEWTARLERLAREARGRGVVLVVSAMRVAGPLGRVIDLLPHRALLALPSRADHVAAGGESADFVAAEMPGRGRWGRLLVQFVDAGAPVPAAQGEAAPVWIPGRRPAALVLPPGPRHDRVGAACERGGRRVLSVEEAASADPPAPPAVVVGSPEDWLAQWRLLSDARARAELVVDAAYAAEYRALTGRRDLPPYALPGAGRAWLHAPDGAVRRVTLPD